MKVAVFGGGIAGLSAAHELAERGHEVQLFEHNDSAGGFFRSARRADMGDLPTEYSWHGFGPWYHNTFDLLQRIPYDERRSVYDAALSRPVDFGVAPDRGEARFGEGWDFFPRRIFRMTHVDVVTMGWLLLKTWTAHRRSQEVYSTLPAADAFRPGLTELGWRTWRATFGPWVGSDWTRVSLHQVGLFFRKHLFAGRCHRHPSDEQGDAWLQTSGTGWLVLREPSNEAWFDRWVGHLRDLGVEVHFERTLDHFEVADHRVASAKLTDGESVHADAYVLATHPFAAERIVRRSGLHGVDQLDKLAPLVQDGPHIQVSFRLGFAERLRWPRERTALVIADSEWNLTLFAQEQAWHDGTHLGDGVGCLWTVTACVATAPGRVHGVPLIHCTEEQFWDEVLAQLRGCHALDASIRQANGGRSWHDATLVHREIWPEWSFHPEGLRGRQPKWVDSVRTQPWLPDQRTGVANLVLAGAHTRTDADLWSIEGAVESGRRAAGRLDATVHPIPEHVPLWMQAVRVADDAAYALGAPHVLDLAAAGVAGALTAAVARRAGLRGGGWMGALVAGAMVGWTAYREAQRRPSMRAEAHRGGFANEAHPSVLPLGAPPGAPEPVRWQGGAG